MKVRIKDWDDAVKSALADSENLYVEDDSIFGIKREFGDWGEVIEGYKDGTYFCNDKCFSYPLCVVDEIIEDDVDEIVEDNTELVNPDNILRYGKVITDDDMLVSDHDAYEHIRIRLISYNGDLYYHKMVDGEVVECSKVGMADDTE